ncbi:MAG TPA: hypothetical protein VF196_00765, partial [Casimicrobiaceae bacterium]
RDRVLRIAPHPNGSTALWRPPGHAAPPRARPGKQFHRPAAESSTRCSLPGKHRAPPTQGRRAITHAYRCHNYKQIVSTQYRP